VGKLFGSWGLIQVLRQGAQLRRGWYRQASHSGGFAAQIAPIASGKISVTSCAIAS